MSNDFNSNSSSITQFDPSLKDLRHVPVLDGLRAFAALIVCVYHFVVGPIDFITNPVVLDWFSYGKYGVQLFFVISGFIIPWSLSYKSYKISNFFIFLFKRFIRLEPPYIFSLLIVLLLYYLRSVFLTTIDSREFSSQQLLLHFGYLIPFFEDYKWINEVYWTLAIEFQYYIFIAIVYFLLIDKRAIIRYFSYLLFFSLSFIGNDEFLLYWLPVFLLGNLLFLYKRNFIKEYEYYIISILCFIIIVINMNIAVLIASLFTVVFILYFQNIQHKITNWLGKISYSIYLLHTIIGSAFINILSHHVNNGMEKIGVIIGGIGITIFFSYLTYKIIEEKSQNISKKIKF